MKDYKGELLEHEVKCKAWIENAYKAIRENKTGVVLNGNRTLGQMMIRRCLMYIAYKRFYPYVPLRLIGEYIASCEGRSKPYDHSTVYYAINRHEESVSLPNSFKKYLLLFNEIKQISNAYNH